MAFKVGDKCVVPNVGVGIVREIKGMELEGTTYEVYEIKILDNAAIFTCPVDQADANGLRDVIPLDAVERVYDVLRDRETPTDKQTWNRRYREYRAKINTGHPLEVSAVLRDLALLKLDKPLSFGERNVYDLAYGLIIQEISVARDVDEEVIKGEIAAIFQP